MAFGRCSVASSASSGDVSSASLQRAAPPPALRSRCRSAPRQLGDLLRERRRAAARLRALALQRVDHLVDVRAGLALEARDDVRHLVAHALRAAVERALDGLRQRRQPLALGRYVCSIARSWSSCASSADCSASVRLTRCTADACAGAGASRSRSGTPTNGRPPPSPWRACFATISRQSAPKPTRDDRAPQQDGALRRLGRARHDVLHFRRKQRGAERRDLARSASSNTRRAKIPSTRAARTCSPATPASPSA